MTNYGYYSVTAYSILNHISYMTFLSPYIFEFLPLPFLDEFASYFYRNGKKPWIYCENNVPTYREFCYNFRIYWTGLLGALGLGLGSNGMGADLVFQKISHLSSKIEISIPMGFWNFGLQLAFFSCSCGVFCTLHSLQDE